MCQDVKRISSAWIHNRKTMNSMLHQHLHSIKQTKKYIYMYTHTRIHNFIVLCLLIAAPLLGVNFHVHWNKYHLHNVQDCNNNYLGAWSFFAIFCTKVQGDIPKGLYVPCRVYHLPVPPPPNTVTKDSHRLNLQTCKVFVRQGLWLLVLIPEGLKV